MTTDTTKSKGAGAWWRYHSGHIIANLTIIGLIVLWVTS